ncbi:MAG TPA: hypothetical protein DCF45_07335 [Gammaproteobacteria bacterium]|nr:hypothetical protein [Gammaproteobacteria bacterium]
MQAREVLAQKGADLAARLTVCGWGWSTPSTWLGQINRSTVHHTQHLTDWYGGNIETARVL